MPDINDFYAFKTTSSGSDSGSRNNNSNNGNSGRDTSFNTVLIALAIIGWVLWFIGRFFC